MPKPPDWVLSITDQEAAESCRPYTRANLICPPLEWQARDGMLCGTDIGCTIKFYPPLGDPNRLDVWLRFLRAPIRLRMWWNQIEGPIYSYPLRVSEWHMTQLRILVEPDDMRDDLIVLPVLSPQSFMAVAQRITCVIEDGYSYDALRAALIDT